MGQHISEIVDVRFDFDTVYAVNLAPIIFILMESDLNVGFTKLNLFETAGCPRMKKARANLGYE
jgi:hypothetical protein